MPPPSQLAIAASAVVRLLKEKESYHKELLEQEASLKTLEEKAKSGEDDEDGNAEYMVRQQKLVVEQTKNVFGPLDERIEAATAKLKDVLAVAESEGSATPEDLEKANAALERGQTVLS